MKRSQSSAGLTQENDLIETMVNPPRLQVALCHVVGVWGAGATACVCVCVCVYVAIGGHDGVGVQLCGQGFGFAAKAT